MLVCGVSIRPRRDAIAASIVEAATAVDATATGNIVFATLVDDPSNARDITDAYIGEIMVEAASAADLVEAGLIYAAAIEEAVTADAIHDGSVPVVLSGAVTETASAADTPDATVSAVSARDGMVMGVFVNSDGTSREANAAGVMVNL